MISFYPKTCRFAVGKFKSASSKTGLFDSGFSVILFESDEFQAVYKQIQPDFDQETKLYITDCSNFNNFDDWIFTMQGTIDFKFKFYSKLSI